MSATPDIVIAAKGNELSRVDELLAAGANVNAQDEKGSTGLSQAAGEGHTEMVERLIAAGADIHAQCKAGWTALTVAASYGQTAVVDRLIAAGADVNAQSEEGDTALRTAAFHGHTAVIERLIAAGADVNERSIIDAETVLMCAARGGQAAAVERLIALGADVNAQDEDGYTALYLAIFGDNPSTGIWADVAEVLIAAGADCNLSNERGQTALALATEKGLTELVLRMTAESKDRAAREAKTALKSPKALDDDAAALGERLGMLSVEGVGLAPPMEAVDVDAAEGLDDTSPPVAKAAGVGGERKEAEGDKAGSLADENV